MFTYSDTRRSGAAPLQCDMWQWKTAPTNGAWQKGCWVAPPAFVIGQPNSDCPGCGKGTSTDTSWLGAQHCLRPGPGGSQWGQTVLLVLLISGGVYLGGGVAFGSITGRGRRNDGKLGPLSAHPHTQLWLEIAGLAGDGVALVRGRGGARRGGGGASMSGSSPLLSSKDKKHKREKPQKGSGSGRSDKSSKKKDKKDKRAKSGGGRGRGERAALVDKCVASAGPVVCAGPGWSGSAAELAERRDGASHSSQQKIKVRSVLRSV